jgi:hypothetical protein
MKENNDKNKSKGQGLKLKSLPFTAEEVRENGGLTVAELVEAGLCLSERAILSSDKTYPSWFEVLQQDTMIRVGILMYFRNVNLGVLEDGSLEDVAQSLLEISQSVQDLLPGIPEEAFSTLITTKEQI